MGARTSESCFPERTKRAHGTVGLNPALSLFPFRVIPNATVAENGIQRPATLVVGMHYDARRMIVVDASEAASPRVIGQWEAPEGTALIRQRRNLSYDPETGWLGFAVMKNGGRHWLAVDVSRNAVELDLRPASELVDRFVLKAVSENEDEVEASDTQASASTAPAESKEYVLFVHGWNTAPWESGRWLETTFKRLWWLGYKGRVGGFQWPTRVGLTTYNPSELRAWRSGPVLARRLEALNQLYPGEVRVIAHSMGNVVVGEALKALSGPVVHSYIAMQGAIPASSYDNTAPRLDRPFWDFDTTPDILGHYSDGKEGASYLEGNKLKVQEGRLFNYFNTDDFALARWEENNFLKPDSNAGYFYADRDGDSETYHPNEFAFMGDEFFTYHGGIAPLILPRDMYEVFARCVESQAKALGASPAVNGFSGLDLRAMFGFDRAHYSHSRQFRSNIVSEQGFWMRVRTDLRLGQPATPPQN